MRSQYQIFLVVYTRLDTAIECVPFNGGNGIWYGDRCQSRASSKRMAADGSDRIGDNGAFASNNQSVIFGVNYGIAIICRIIRWVSFLYDDFFQIAARGKSGIVDSGDRTRDGDGCQPLAYLKSIVPDGSYGIWDSDGGKSLTPREGKAWDGSNRLRNSNGWQFFTVIEYRTTECRYRIGDIHGK